MPTSDRVKRADHAARERERYRLARAAAASPPLPGTTMLAEAFHAITSRILSIPPGSPPGQTGSSRPYT